MVTKTEPNHAGEFILSEGNRTLSREAVTVASGENLKAGQVVAEVTKGSASAAADAGNTGDGTIGAITVGAGSKQGDYKLTFIEPGTDAGDFQVEDPEGVNVGTGVVGTEFSGGGLTFTVSDGAADFVAGDQFTITVAEGSGKVVALDTAGVDGSETAAGVLYDAVDASSADTKGVMIARDAEVNDNVLVWPDGISQANKDAAIANLKTKGIIVR